MKNKRLIFLVGFITVLFTFCQNEENSVLADLETMFQQGSFCQINKEIAAYENILPKENMEWYQLQLLAAKTNLELENWSKVDTILKDLSKIPNGLQGDYNLLAARLVEKKGNNQKADSLYLSVTDNLEKDNPTLRKEALTHYGIFLFNTEAFAEAEKILVLATQDNQIASSTLGRAFIALGTLYDYQAKNTLAEQAYRKAKAIWEDNNWTNHPHYALFLNDYAISLFQKGKITMADSLLMLSEQINQTTCAIPSIEGYNWSAKGNFNFFSGNLNQAIDDLSKAIEVFNILNLQKETAMALVRLGEVHSKLDNYTKADSCFRLSLSHADTFFQGANSFVATAPLQSLAESASYDGNYIESDSLFSLAINTISQKLGQRNNHYATAISNWGRTKEWYEEDVSTAIRKFRQVEHLDTLLLGSKHPNYLTTLFNLARIYTEVDSTELVNEYYQKANDLQLVLLENYFANFDESARLNYRGEVMKNFDVFFEYACEKQAPNLLKELGRINLMTKNRALDYSLQTLQKVRNPTQATPSKHYQQWLNLKQQYADFAFKNQVDLASLGISLDSLQQEIGRLEKFLVRTSIATTATASSDEIVNQLFNKLQTDEVAIDFFNLYEWSDEQKETVQIPYFALIYKKEYQSPKLVKLPDSKAIKRILKLSSHYTFNAEVNYLLYQKIWQPLEPYLEGVNKVHLSPDGFLHQISFAGLATSTETDQTLLDRYSIHYYSNLLDFVKKQEKENRLLSIMLVGNPDYDGQPKEPWQNEFPFISLPGTAIEVESIKDILSGKGLAINQFQQQEASENTFRKQTKQLAPNIIHLATHGYFYQRDTTIQQIEATVHHIKTSKNALLRSGIVFSDVNNTWLTKVTDKQSINDGILSALEIANLNLSKTNLVVLSACDTGKGDIIDGEGVFGLQRAFKKAGVSNLLISLWKVPDNITSELMHHFYSNLAEGASPQQALIKAQKGLAKLYPNPYNWAGFVVFG